MDLKWIYQFVGNVKLRKEFNWLHIEGLNIYSLRWIGYRIRKYQECPLPKIFFLGKFNFSLILKYFLIFLNFQKMFF